MSEGWWWGEDGRTTSKRIPEGRGTRRVHWFLILKAGLQACVEVTVCQLREVSHRIFSGLLRAELLEDAPFPSQPGLTFQGARSLASFTHGVQDCLIAKASPRCSLLTQQAHTQPSFEPRSLRAQLC